MNITFKLDKVNTPNKLLIDFGPKFFKIRTLINGTLSEVFKFSNTLFHISESRVQNLEREFKDAFALKSGMFTRAEIEAAQLLLQADEKIVDLSNKFQIERAYTNLFEILPEKLQIDFRTDDIDFSSWSVFLTIPVTQDFEELIKAHLNILKSLGFIYIKPMDYLTSSFYSQKGLLGSENVKHKYGILVNVSDKTEIGVFDEELLENGFTQISLGVNTVIEYCLAILRDLNIRGFKRELLEEWVQADGTCLNDARSVIKNIRKKDVDIQIILNSPYILFDYFKVTSLKNNDVNSIPEAIITLLNSHKRIRKNINKILANVIIVGPGSEYRGFGTVLHDSLAKEIGSNATIIEGNDPNNSEINGLLEFITTEEIQECYNVNRIEINDEMRKNLEKQSEPQLKQIDITLKEIKSKNYFYPENITNLNQGMELIFNIITNLPEGLNTAIENKIFAENQKFAKEFAKQLKNIKKSSEKNLEKASENLHFLNTLLGQINNFNVPPLKQLFSNQLAPVLLEVRKIKTNFEEKMANEYIKVISKVLKKELSKNQWFILEDLVKETNLSNDVILRLNPLIIKENNDIGFLDGRFVKYSMDLLIPAYNFLDTLIITIGDKIASNDSYELLDDFNQALDYSIFLEGGFSYINENDYLESVIVKKEYLTEERMRLFQK